MFAHENAQKEPAGPPLGPDSKQSNQPDRRLGSVVGRIQAGDSQAIGDLHSILYRGIRFFAQRQVGSIDAEDVTQETLLVTFRAIQNGVIQNPDALLGFARTVARREVIRIIERRKMARTELADVSLARICDPRSNPEQDVLADESQALMVTALKALSARDREILTRFYLYGRTKEQICLEMCLTATQFRLLKSRAKARLTLKGRTLVGSIPPYQLAIASI